jgi:hypothetical protein
MDRKKKIILIIFFPVTAYLFIGTSLFFILTLIDALAEALGHYSEFPGLKDYSSTSWYDRNIWLTIFFPLTWSVLFIWIGCVLLCSAIAALLMFIYRALKKMWKIIVDLVTSIWEWFTKSFREIWEWTIRSIIDIFITIIGFFAKK